MSEVIVRDRRASSPDRVAVVTGPNLAPEIAAEQPAATVVACTDIRRAAARAAGDHARRTCGRTPTTTSSAASWAARSRTSIALAYGIAHAMGFGDNTKATLITRGLAETARLAWRWAPTR